ncbi:MAG: DNA circularization N-terminal domain-containing protein [Gammaproteobacteria bacterium]
MSGLAEKYVTASFRGVPFFFRSEGSGEGRKTVVHDFVNSDRRFVEDLGRLPQTFTFDAFVSGIDAFAKRDNLRRVLDTPGSGILSHPVRGNVEVTATSYSIRSTNNAVGRIDFFLTFAASSTVDEPTIGQATGSTLSDLSETIRTIVEQVALGRYLRPTDSGFLNELFGLNTDVAGFLDQISASISDGEVRESINPIINSILTDRGLPSNPETLFSNIQTIFRSASGLGDPNKYHNLLGEVQSLVPFIPENTSRRIRRVLSFGALGSSFQVNSLVGAYQAATAIDYDTVPELEQAEARLNDSFESVVENPIVESVVADPDIKADLLNMRSLAADIFDEKEQLAWKVEDFDPSGRGFAATTYRLYGNLDNLDLIARLNPSINASSPNSGLPSPSEFRSLKVLRQ